MPGNPFNNLSDRPDRGVTAAAAVVLWLTIAGLMVALTAPPFNWIAGLAIAAHAVRMGAASRRAKAPSDSPQHAPDGARRETCSGR